MSALGDRPIGVLGAGALGCALALRLGQCGADVEVWARRDEVARLARELGLRATTDLARVAARPVLLVCVRDAAIGEVAAAASGASSAPLAVALHTSGCTGEEALLPLRRRGAALGWWHPLAPVASGGALPAGTPFGLGGEAGAVAQAEALADRLGARVVRVAPGAQARYHAAASLAAGGTIALAEAARALLAGAVSEPSEALEVVRHLVLGAAQNLARVEPHEALTGPAVRDDLATLASHGAALAAPDPAAERARALVRALAPVVLELVRRRSPGEPERTAALARAFDELFRDA